MPGPVTLTTGGQVSNAYGFTALFNPIITSLSPASGLPGVLVTIHGNEFGYYQMGSTVSFNGVDAGTAVEWTNDQIVIAVPAGARTEIKPD